MTDTDFLRLAVIHRRRGGSWEAFWAANAAAVKDAFPEPRERMKLVHRLQEVVLQGGSGKPCEPIS